MQVPKMITLSLATAAVLFAQTSPTTDPFYTLTDLNSRLETGAAGTAVPFAQPTGAPGTVSVKSLADIMAKMPAVNASAALENQVIAGRWFWGLDASGWGLKQGTLAVTPPLAIVPGTEAKTIPAGYYASAGSVAGDANLVAGNIKSGVTIFNVAGTAPVPSGTATAEKVLSGSTFSNDNGTAIPGTMANIGVQNITPSTSEQPIAAGFHNGSGKVAGDVNLVSANIKAGSSIFGVNGKSSVVETETATAAADKILAGEKAFVKGAEVTGTLKRITYNLNGGYNAESNPAWFTSSDVTLAKPVCEGWLFDGWYTASDFSGTPVTTITAASGEITVYAKWKRNGVAVVPSMVSLPGGTFSMGKVGVAEPVHEVTVSPFSMSVTEITQRQYQALMGVNPSEFIGDLSRPVEIVSWFDAVLYCNALSRYEGKDTVYTYTSKTMSANTCSDLSGIAIDYTRKGYRLPTEAEWEYACRGGKQYEYGTDDGSISSAKANYSPDASHQSLETKFVGNYPANPFGLYDLSGNVLEWCNDFYDSYRSGPAVNPQGLSGIQRVIRGGSWLSASTFLHSAYRSSTLPKIAVDRLGFRCVLAR